MQLAQKWKELGVAERGQRINVASWLARCTLDVIGEGASLALVPDAGESMRAADIACAVGFEVECGALDDSLNPVMDAYKNMLCVYRPTRARVAWLT